MTTVKQLKEELRAKGVTEKEALGIALDSVKAEKSQDKDPLKKSSAVFVAPAAGLAALVDLLRK